MITICPHGKFSTDLNETNSQQRVREHLRTPAVKEPDDEQRPTRRPYDQIMELKLSTTLRTYMVILRNESFRACSSAQLTPHSRSVEDEIKRDVRSEKWATK